MTVQEVIEQLRAMYPKTSRLVDGRYTGGFDDHNSKGGVALDMAIEVLEKQIPKEPYFEGDGYYDGSLVYDTWRCPSCDSEYEVEFEEHECCPHCGQAIKWE